MKYVHARPLVVYSKSIPSKADEIRAAFYVTYLCMVKLIKPFSVYPCIRVSDGSTWDGHSVVYRVFRMLSMSCPVLMPHQMHLRIFFFFFFFFFCRKEVIGNWDEGVLPSWDPLVES